MSDASSGAPAPSFSAQVPPGDDRTRLVCDACGYVRYDNPKVVVGAVAWHGGRILMCRRAIGPRRGYWTLPAGYLELHETSEEGAAREAWEEARARVALDGLLAVFNIPRISQVQLIYRARLLDADVAPGPESAEVALLAPADIFWDELAFPSVRWALERALAVGDAQPLVPTGNPPGDRGDMPGRE